MIIRKMSEGDIPGVQTLLCRCFSDPWSPDVLRSTLSRADVLCTVACEDDTIIGFLAFECILDEGGIELIATDPAYRRRGLARQMLSEAFDSAEDLRVITLEVRASNTPAIALYESLGFEPIAVRRAYYTDNGEDAVIMQKHI